MATSADGSNFIFSQEFQSMSTQQPENFSQASFANITRSENLPKRNAGILINFIEETQIQDYIRAVGTIVGPRNVKHAARISANRICIFLTSKELVENLVTTHSVLKIKDQSTEVRRLVAPEQRVVISNIWPDIPNYLVENIFRQNNIKLLSPITHIKYNDIEDEYYVCTFRRQVQISAEDARLLPVSAQIEHEKRKYHIFFSTDVTCFSCKEKGHIAKKCPKKQQITTELQMQIPAVLTPSLQSSTQPRVPVVEAATSSHQNLSEITTPSQQIIIDDVVSTPKNSQVQIVSEEATDFILVERKRKGITSSPSESSLEEADTIKNTENQEEVAQVNDLPIEEEKQNYQHNEGKKGKQKAQNLKKSKRSESPENISSIAGLLEPVSSVIELRPNKYILSYNQLVQLIEEVQSSGNYLKTAEKYTDKIPSLILALQDLRKYLCGQGKNRITRVIHKLNDELNAKLEKEQTHISQPTSNLGHGSATVE